LRFIAATNKCSSFHERRSTLMGSQEIRCKYAFIELLRFGGGGWYTYNTSSYIAFFGRKAYDTVNGTSSPDVNRRDRAVGALDRDRQGTKHPAAQTMAMCRWLHGARARDAGNWTSLSGTNPFFYPHQTAPVLYADGHVVNADFTAYAQVVNIYGYPVPYYDWFTPSQVYKGKTYYRIDGFGSL